MGAGRAGTCTLLGPEGPGAAPAAVRISVRVAGGAVWTLQAFVGPAGWLADRGFWPSVENYIVDASILDQPFRGLVT